MAIRSPFDELLASGTTTSTIAEEPLVHTPMPGEMPEQTTQRVIQNRVRKGRELAGYGVPSYVDKFGDAQPVTDETGAALTGFKKSQGTAFDSLGMPRQVIYGQPGKAPVLGDAYANAETKTDPKTGTIYKVRPGLPKQPVGTDESVVAANERKRADRELSAMSTALGRKLSLDEAAFHEGEKQLKNELKAFKGVIKDDFGKEFEIPEGTSWRDARKLVNDQYVAALKSKDATKTGWFSSELTDDAKKRKEYLTQRRMLALDAISRIESQASTLKQQADVIAPAKETRQQIARQRLENQITDLESQGLDTSSLRAQLSAAAPQPVVPQEQAQPPQPQPEVESDQESGVTAKDLAVAFGSGASSLLKMAGDLYGLAAGDMDNWASRAGKENIAWYEERKSKGFKKAEAARNKVVEAQDGDLIGEAWAYISETLANPSLIPAFISEQIPNLVGTGGTGALAKKATAKLLLKEASTDAAKALASKVGVATAVGTGAAMQGADVGAGQYEDLVARLADMPAQDAIAIPEIAELIERGAPLDEAKLAYALLQARKTGALAAAVSLASQRLPGAKTIEQAMLGGAAGKGIVRGAIRGALGESTQEAIEEGGGVALQNVFAQDVDPTRSLTKGVGSAAAAGALTSGIMGGVAGGLSRGDTDTEEGDITDDETPPDAPEPIEPLSMSAGDQAIDVLRQNGYTDEQISAMSEDERIERSFDNPDEIAAETANQEEAPALSPPEPPITEEPVVETPEPVDLTGLQEDMQRAQGEALVETAENRRITPAQGETQMPGFMRKPVPSEDSELTRKNATPTSESVMQEQDLMEQAQAVELQPDGAMEPPVSSGEGADVEMMPMPGVLPGGNKTTPSVPKKQYSEALAVFKNTREPSLIDLQRIHAGIASGLSPVKAASKALSESNRHSKAREAVDSAIKSGEINTGQEAQDLYEKTYSESTPQLETKAATESSPEQPTQSQPSPTDSLPADKPTSGDVGGKLSPATKISEAAKSDSITAEKPEQPPFIGTETAKTTLSDNVAEPAAQEKKTRAMSAREMAAKGMPIPAQKAYGVKLPDNYRLNHETEMWEPAPPKQSKIELLAQGALNSHAKALDAIGHGKTLTRAKLNFGSGIASVNGKIVVDPERLEQSTKDMDATKQSAFIQQAIAEEVIHAASEKWVSEDKTRRKQVEQLATDEKEIADELAKQYNGWEKLDGYQKGSEVLRVIIQGKGGITTESTYRMLKDFIAWLKKQVDFLNPRTKKVVAEIEKMLGRFQSEQKEAGSAKENARAKEPWEMTASEYKQAAKERYGPKGQEDVTYAGLDDASVGIAMRWFEEVRRLSKATFKSGADILAYYDKHGSNAPHRAIVEAALREGKPVPESVLADYPDLQKKEGESTLSSAEPTSQSESDKAYLAAVERGDMEAAQTMVDEAAKAAGYANEALLNGDDLSQWGQKRRELETRLRIARNNVKAASAALETSEGSEAVKRIAAKSLARNQGIADDIQNQLEVGTPPKKLSHGSSRTWTEYKRKPGGRAIWATDSADVAASYGTDSTSLFMKMSNPLIVDAEGASFRNLSFEGKRLDADDLSAIAEERGYDGLVIRNFYDSNDDSGGDHIADHFAVFDPSQIKSADPVTYDDAGKVIPLSQRFNPKSDSILYSGEPETTGTKNAKTGERITPKEKQSQDEWMDEAKSQMEDDPTIVDSIIDDIAANPRSFTPTEEKIFQREIRSVKNAINGAENRVIEANGDADKADKWLKQSSELQARMQSLYDTAQIAGSEWGRIGVSRQAELNEDFSFAALVRKMRVYGNNGAELSEEQMKELRSLRAKFEAAEKNLSKANERITELEAEDWFNVVLDYIENTKKEAAAFKGESDAFWDKVKSDAQSKGAAKSFFGKAEKPEGLSAASPALPQEVQMELNKVGLSEIGKGNDTIEKFTDAMVKEYGDGIKPYLEKTFAAATRARKAIKLVRKSKPTKEGEKPAPAKELKDPKKGKSTKEILESITDPDAPLDQKQVWQLIANEIEAGAGGGLTGEGKAVMRAAVEGVTKKLNDRMKEIGSDAPISETDVRVAFTGYGKTTKPSQEQTLKKMREVREIALLATKIEAAQANIQPLKTGKQRDEATQAMRDMMKELANAMKRANFPPSPGKIKSALDAVKTRLNNAIADLQRQLATGEKIPKREGIKYDEEATQLKAKVEELRAQVRAIEGKPEISEEQKLRNAISAAERSIKDLDEKIQKGDTSTETKAGVTSPELELLRAERDAMRGYLNEMRAAEKPQLSDDEKWLAAQKKSIATRTKKLKERIKNKDFAPKVPKDRPVDKDYEKARYEYDKTKEDFARGVFNEMLKRRSFGKRVLDRGQEAINTMRAIITGVDLSAPLRQGAFIGLAHPKRALKAFMPMLKAFASEQYAHTANERLKQRPNRRFYKQGELYFADHEGIDIRKMEENFMSRWINEPLPNSIRSIPVIGGLVEKGRKVIAGSARAYSTFLNILRADAFDAMLETLSMNSKNPTTEELQAIGSFINKATGRGGLGKSAGTAGSFLSTVFFSPRLAVSRFQLLAGVPMWGGSMQTRKLVAKEYARFLTGVAVVYALASLAQDDDDPPIETDARSSDFLKVRFGNTRLDPMAGLIQPTVLSTRLIRGSTKTLSGKVKDIRGADLPYGSDDAGDVAFRFLRTKFSPAMGTTWDVVSGKNVIGQPTTPGSVLKQSLVPMSIREVSEIMDEQSIPKGAALSMLAILGMGMNTFDANSKKVKTDPNANESTVSPSQTSTSVAPTQTKRPIFQGF